MDIEHGRFYYWQPNERYARDFDSPPYTCFVADAEHCFINGDQSRYSIKTLMDCGEFTAKIPDAPALTAMEEQRRQVVMQCKILTVCLETELAAVEKLIAQANEIMEQRG